MLPPIVIWDEKHLTSYCPDTPENWARFWEWRNVLKGLDFEAEKRQRAQMEQNALHKGRLPH